MGRCSILLKCPILSFHKCGVYLCTCFSRIRFLQTLALIFVPCGMKTKFVFPQPEIPAQTMADLGCRLCSTFQKRSGIPVRSFEYTREFCELYFSFTAQIFSSVNTNSIRIGSFEPLEKITTTCDALFYRLSCKSFSFRSFKWFKPKVSRNYPTS